MNTEMTALCSWDKGQCLDRISQGVELLKAEVSRARIGGISRPELGGGGGGSRIGDFPAQGLMFLLLLLLWEARDRRIFLL